jgi:lysophospholipase L1-like esterase
VHQQAQQQLDFFSANAPDGYNAWLQERRAKITQFARQLGLPLGHFVEIWLRGGIRLKGKLLLREEKIFIPAARDLSLELTVDGVHFRPGEVESCVRLD